MPRAGGFHLRIRVDTQADAGVAGFAECSNRIPRDLNGNRLVPLRLCDGYRAGQSARSAAILPGKRSAISKAVIPPKELPTA